jgi:exosortase E/protease (VPEID-CTERM system)
MTMATPDMPYTHRPGRWLGLLGLLAVQAMGLRFVRWQAIEDAKAFASVQLSFLAAHRDLVKIVLFISIALALLLVKDLAEASNRQRIAAHRVSSERLALNLLAAVLLGSLIWGIPSAPVNAWLGSATLGLPVLYGALVLSWGVVVISALALLVPLSLVVQALRQNALGASVVVVGAVVYVLTQSYLTAFEAAWSKVLLPPTVAVATQFSALIGIDAVPRTGTPYFGTERFIVDIGPTCLGYQGVSIVLLLLLSYIISSGDRLRVGRSLLLLPVAVGTMLLLNAVRIAVLVGIGDQWSPEVAVMGFHSTAGWVELILTLVIVVLALNHYTFFLRPSTQRSVAVTASALLDEVFLLPQVALIGVSFITQMFTGAFYWLYPVHITAAAYVFWRYRAVFPIPQLGAPGVAVAGGVVVFVLWVALIPPDVEAAQTFTEELFSASPAWVVFWLIARFAGTALVVPLVEELAFRAFLLRQVQRWSTQVLPPPLALASGVILSAVTFGVLHSAWLAGSLAGLIYAGVYLRKGKLYDAVLAHAITNLLLALYAVLFERWSYL